MLHFAFQTYFSISADWAAVTFQNSDKSELKYTISVKLFF